jgi:hypothetical protein
VTATRRKASLLILMKIFGGDAALLEKNQKISTSTVEKVKFV